MDDSKKNKNKNEKSKIQQATFKFRFSKDQQNDLKHAFDIFDKDGTGIKIIILFF
jgi:Ca2+-binding EF-hand superfamily protein